MAATSPSARLAGWRRGPFEAPTATASSGGETGSGGLPDADPPRSALRIMLACAVIMFASVGVGFYGIAVIVDQLMQSVGVAVGVVSGGTSALLLASCLANPIASTAMRRVGTRTTIALGGMIAAGGLGLFALGREPAVLLTAFVLVGAGSAACSYLPVSSILIGLPSASRSLGMTVSYSGGTVGGIVLAPAMLAVSAAIGFGPSLLVSAGLLLVVVVAGAYAGLPGGTGGDRISPRAALRAPRLSGDLNLAGGIVTPAADGLSLHVALRLGSFWWLLLALALTGSTVTAVQLQILTVARFAEVASPGAITVLVAGAVALARFAGVGLLRVLTPRGLSILVCGVQAASFLLVAFAPNEPLFLVGSALVGASMGLTVLLSPLLTVDVVGRTAFAQIYGVILAVTGIVNALGPAAMGAMFDPEAGYAFSLTLFAALAMLAGLAFALISSSSDRHEGRTGTRSAAA